MADDEKIFADQRGGDNAGVEATREHNGTRTAVN
jgi:hypothetical protein